MKYTSRFRARAGYVEPYM